MPVVQLAIGRSPSNFSVYCPARLRSRLGERIDGTRGGRGCAARAGMCAGQLEPQVPGQARKKKKKVTLERQCGGAGAPRQAGLMTVPARRESSKFLTLEFSGDESGTGKD